MCDQISYATTPDKRPPIRSTKIFPVKALQLEPLPPFVSDHLMHSLIFNFAVCTMLIRIY